MQPVLSFEAVFGSRNYNLMRPDSDTDKMFFYNPSFDDLYQGKLVSDRVVSVSTSHKHYDVRKIPQLIFKANVNALELFHTNEFVTYDGLYRKLAPYKEEMARMNLPFLYECCFGIFQQNYRRMDQQFHYVSQEDLHNPELHDQKLGKSAGRAYWILDFLERYHKTDFQMFGRAIRYEDDVEQDQLTKQLIFDMKDGHYRYPHLVEILKEKEERVKELKTIFKEENSLNEQLNQAIIQIVKDHVASALYRK